jgi:hypothetical protein
LAKQRFDQIEFRDVGADTSTRLGQVLTVEELNQIRSDLSEISTPTWVPSIPSNLGNASHGKLKADQWRTLGITHLPLSLIRLWGARDSNDPRSQKFWILQSRLSPPSFWHPPEPLPLQLQLRILST